MSRWRTAICAYCGSEWRTRSATARTCSPICRARLREQEHGPTHTKQPRDYPPELVDKIRSLYESGLTTREVQQAIPGVRIDIVMRRHGIAARPAAPTIGKHAGERSVQWKGDDASYTAFHLRVYKARGKASHCSECGRSDTGTEYEWANLSGDYANIDDYAPMCLSCHHLYDADRRRRTGERTAMGR
jgi:hypothetical protein